MFAIILKIEQLRYYVILDMFGFVQAYFKIFFRWFFVIDELYKTVTNPPPPPAAGAAAGLATAAEGAGAAARWGGAALAGGGDDWK